MNNVNKITLSILIFNSPITSLFTNRIIHIQMQLSYSLQSIKLNYEYWQYGAFRHHVKVRPFFFLLLGIYFFQKLGPGKKLNHWKHWVSRNKLTQSSRFWKICKIQYPTIYKYSGLLWFYIIFLHWYSKSVWQWYPLACLPRRSSGPRQCLL